MSFMLSLFLGAGFSKWSVGLPVANQLFDFGISVWGPREENKINIVKSLKRDWDRFHPESPAEDFIADALNFDEKEMQAVLWYVGRRLSEPFIWKKSHSGKWRRRVLMMDENYKLSIQGIKTAQAFFTNLCLIGLAGVITTNYDLIVEYALGTNGFNYGINNQVLFGRGAFARSTWRSPVRLVGNIPVAKIHGSISWDIKEKYTDGRRGLTGNALIVPPTPEKKPSQALRRTWELAETILRKSRNLIIFGFAFNPYDSEVINLLKNSNRDLENILLIDIDPKKDRAKELWPDARITECLPPSEGDSKIEKWLAELRD